MWLYVWGCIHTCARPLSTHIDTQVRENLLARAREFNIIVDDVAITHLSFGTEFTKAVEAKQVAQQEAERARCVLWILATHSVNYLPVVLLGMCPSRAPTLSPRMEPRTWRTRTHVFGDTGLW